MSSPSGLRLLAGHAVRPDVVRRDRPVRVRGDVRPDVLVEVVSEDEAVSTSAGGTP